MSDRTTVSLLTAHIRLFAKVIVLIKLGRVAEAYDVFAAGVGEFEKMSGAMNSALAPTPVDVKPEILFGDFSRKEFYARTDEIVSYPFRMPAHGTLHVATSEYNGTRWARTLTISETAGDMSAPLGSPLRSDGTLPDIYLTVGEQFPAGTLLYANNVLAEEPSIPNSANSGTSIVWPAP